MDTVTEEEVEDVYSNPEETIWIDESDISQLCRVCANPNEYLIPIFHGEGIENDLQSKISKHLPIKVSENDKLPVQLCYQCASTLIAWHDMVVGCLEAHEKLKSLLPEDEKESGDVVRSVEIGDNDHNLTQCKDSPNISFDVVEKVQTIINSGVTNNETQLMSLSPIYETEKVVGEEIIPFEPEIVEVSTEQRLLAPFSAYHHTQTALRMHQWMSSGSVFCMLCGKVNKNLSTLFSHISSEHNIYCAQCRVAFANKDQLTAHLFQHDRKKYSTGEKHLSKDLKSKVNSSFNLNLDLHSISLQSICRKSYSSKKACIREDQTKYMFQCDTCSTVFSRRFDLKRHNMIYHSEKHSDKENSGDKSVNRGEEKNEISMCTNESLDSFVGSIRSDVEDVNAMNFSDDSVNSEDISRHLDVSTYSSSQVGYKVTNENQSFTCSLCGFACPKRQEMFSHRRKEHSLKEQKISMQKSASSKIFLCSLCQNSYSRSSDLQRHILKKHGGEKFMGRCVDSVDDMSVDLINRAKNDINGTIVYQCDICKKNMLTKRGFARHIRIHRDERPFTCHVCGRQYRSHPDLTRHLRSVHDKVKNYPCDICGRSFASKGTRDDHRRTHTGERPYVCHTCGKAFPTPNSIYVHRRTHSDYFPHHCTTCSKKFRRRQQLTHHMRTHTGEKPHSCDVCGKCFGVKDEVTRHKQTHSNEKPHICPVCGICFGQKRYLTNHMKTHHSRVT